MGLTTFANLDAGMEGRDKIIIGTLIGVLVLIFVAGTWWLKKTKPSAVEAPVVQQQVKKGDIGYSEPETKTAVGTREVSGGTFEKLEAGKLFYTDGGVQTAIPVTDEVAIQCTNQNLVGIKEYDYNEVVKVKIVAPSEVGGIITAGQPIVVLAAKEGAEFKANTVAVAADKCGI